MLKIINKFKVSLLLILLIVFNSIFIDASPVSEIWDNDNVAPTIDLNVMPVKKPVDIVILTDYTGTKLIALNTQINALKAQFSAVNVDPKVHIVSDIKNIGTQNDKLYEFVRYGHFYYKVGAYARFKDYGLEESYTNYTLDLKEEWERVQGLISQYANLPVRNPKNVSFTKGPMQTRKTSSVRQLYHDITIKCTNDVKTTSEVLKEERYYHSTGSSTHRIYNGSQDYHNESFSLISEWAAIDTIWTIDKKISDVSYDIYSLDFNKLSTIPLRTGSDRHMVFLSDAAAKDYSKTFGNYFSFGELTDSVQAYIEDNNFSVYGVASDKARHTTLYPDKVKDIELYGLFTLFHMENGDLLKLGNAFFAQQSDDGAKIYPEVINSFAMDSIKKILTTDKYMYYLMEDGTLQVGSRNSSNFEIEAELSNIKDIVLRNSYGGLWALTNSGQVYRYEYGVEIFPMQHYGVVIDKIICDGKMFLTATGVPYGVFEYYDGEWESNKLVRFRTHYRYKEDGEWEYVWSYLGAVRDVEEYRAGGKSGVIVLYTNNRIEQFLYFDDYREDDKYDNHHDYPSIYRNIDYPYTETNVNSISSTYYGVILHKIDGTTKMISVDIETAEYYDSSRPIPLNNLTEIHCQFKDRNFYKDESNRLYMLISNSAAPLPAGEAIIDMGIMGNEILKFISFNAKGSVYVYNINLLCILYNDGTLKMMSIDSKNGNIIDSIPYTDIKNIYTNGWQLYLLKIDGSVLGVGYSDNGQLGVKRPGQTSFINPFHNVLTFDTTKTYYSLLDLFNEISNNKFYPAGGYATAFNDIYKNYNYSTSGDIYVVLGDDIKYESEYDDFENDPEYTRKWKIAHYPYHFDNSMGMSAYHKPAGFTTSPPTKLDKVGKYVINLYARDNPKSNLKFLSDGNEDKNYYKWSLGNHNLTVYIHRKPVALQRIAVTNNGNGTFTVKAYDAGSYDPDHSNSRPDKGITAREWRWREETSTVWTTGQMNKSDCKPDVSYITQLRVKDLEGVWSDYSTITIDRNNPPIALFNIDKNVINISELLKVKDQSYPQSLSDIIRWHWTVKKLNADGSLPGENLQDAQFNESNTGTGSLAGYDKNVKHSYSSTGRYRISLRVKDSNGLWSDEFSRDIEVDRPPVADFAIEKNPIFVEEALRLKDLSTASGTSPLAKWHWTVKKLNQDGTVPVTSLQDEEFEDSNTGTGEMEGCDVNVKTNYADKGAGTYRIYLRVMNGNGIWSEVEKYEDLVVQESFKMSGFRVVRIRDLHLEPYYESGGKYIDRPFYVDSMAIDPENFMAGGTSLVPGFSSLTKGYRFEFEIDSVNFNEAYDSITVTPAFFPYTTGIPGVRGLEAGLYWEDSDKIIHKAGEGGHSKWAEVTLDSSNRTITGENSAVWRGEYFIPATSWLVPPGTSVNDAKSEKINADIIVNFAIKGYRNGELKYDYNLQQWPEERTAIKNPYEIGDVIRYDHTKSSLEDMDIIINRP